MRMVSRDDGACFASMERRRDEREGVGVLSGTSHSRVIFHLFRCFQCLRVNLLRGLQRLHPRWPTFFSFLKLFSLIQREPESR